MLQRKCMNSSHLERQCTEIYNDIILIRFTVQWIHCFFYSFINLFTFFRIGDFRNKGLISEYSVECVREEVFKYMDSTYSSLSLSFPLSLAVITFQETTTPPPPLHLFLHPLSVPAAKPHIHKPQLASAPSV